MTDKCRHLYRVLIHVKIKPFSFDFDKFYPKELRTQGSIISVNFLSLFAKVVTHARQETGRLLSRQVAT